MKRLSIPLALLLLGHCSLGGAGAYYPGTPLTPRPAWRTWYAELATCANTVGPAFEHIRWWRSPDGMLDTRTQTHVVGRWEPPNTIYLTALIADNNVQDVIAHELLHYKLQQGGDEFIHPPAFARCGL